MRKNNRFKRIELVFPKVNGRKHEQGFALQKNAMKNFVTTVEEIKDWFDLYDIASIDLWISGAVETQGMLKLILSASGQGGVRITLKPKK